MLDEIGFGINHAEKFDYPLNRRKLANFNLDSGQNIDRNQLGTLARLIRRNIPADFAGQPLSVSTDRSLTGDIK